MKYRVTSPDGKNFEVNAPDGATQDEVLAYAQSQWKQPEAPQQSIGQKAIDVANAVGTGGNRGFLRLAGFPVDTAANVIDLLKAGAGSAYGAVTGKVPPEALQVNPDRSNVFGSSDYLINKARQTEAGKFLIDPQNPAYEGGYAQALGSGIATGGRNPVAGAMSTLAGKATTDITGNPNLGMAASMVPLAATSAATDWAQKRTAKLELQKAQNAPRDEALINGLQAGYKVPPSTVSPTLGNKTLESIGGKAATAQDASVNNVEVTDALARKALGVSPDTPLTPEVTQQVRKEAFTQGYLPIRDAGQISTGKLYREDLNKIVAKYQGAERSFPTGQSNPVLDLVGNLRKRTFDAGDAIDKTQILRDNANKAFATGDTGLAQANLAASKAIENQIERSLSGPALDNFRAARQQMAIAHTVEDALKIGTGHVDANKIANEMQAGTPLTGELRTIGAFAQNFKKSVQTPQTVGSPGVSKVAALASMLMGGGGAAAAGAPGAAFGAIPLIAPPLARNLMMSNRFQNSLPPRYNPGLLTQDLASGSPSSVWFTIPPALQAQDLWRNQ